MANSLQYDYVKEHISILDYIKDDIQLKKVGEIYQGLCPFHHEKTPSFTIYPETNSFYCFGCEKAGSIIDYVMFEQGFEHPIEALDYLKKEYQLKFDDDTAPLDFMREKIIELKNKPIGYLDNDAINLIVSCICRNYLTFIKTSDALKIYYEHEKQYIERFYKYFDNLYDTNQQDKINLIIDKITKKLMNRRDTLLIKS